MVRVLIFGTHPNQFNGYSKVIYELCKRVHGVTDPVAGKIEMGVFGFQNYAAPTPQSGHRADIPADLYIFDAWANEEPKAQGFGVDLVARAVAEFKPDVCIIYNDLLIVSTIINKLHEIPDRTFKIVPYIDQVYLNQKKVYIDLVNAKADAAIAFTEHWRKVIVDNGLTLETHVMEHGFDAQKYYPIPKLVARTYLGLSPADFIILNLNRNQPRKRWDTCLKAFAEIVSRMPEAPIKLIVGTAVQGSWDLIEIYERELKKRNMTLADGMKHLVLLDNPQKLTDFDINVLYNVADIGINTCDGEGFGLCNFEQAAIGVPQVVPRLGGFVDFLTDESAMFVDPCIAYYVDSSRDSVCGEALMCSYTDVVIGIENYYNDRELIAQHGKRCRESIPAKYDWAVIAKKLVDIIVKVAPASALPQVVVVEAAAAAAPAIDEIEVVAVETVAVEKKTDDISSVFSNQGYEAGKKKKKSKKSKNSGSGGDGEMTTADLLRMRENIERLLLEKTSK